VGSYKWEVGIGKWGIADKKAWDELLMRCVREKVNKAIL
jgi:hypothetical protein